MAEYNNQSIDIDLEDMFNNLSDKDQEEFLVDMFRNLPGEEERADDRQHTVRLDMGLQHTEGKAWVRQPGSLPEQIRHSQHLLR